VSPSPASSDARAGTDGRNSRVDVVLPALVGLAGVLIGAFVTAGITYLGDRSNRIADERTAKRLIASEVRLDTIRLLVVANQSRAFGVAPRTVAWSSEAATLARFITNDQWSAVERFYDDLLNVEPSLTRKPCVTPNARKLAITVAKEGDAAHEALGNGHISAISKPIYRYQCPSP
jgi:hypothetical protein